MNLKMSFYGYTQEAIKKTIDMINRRKRGHTYTPIYLFKYLGDRRREDDPQITQTCSPLED